MRNPVVILAWVASLVLAWLLGANFGGKGDGNAGRSGPDRVTVVERERPRPRSVRVRPSPTTTASSGTGSGRESC